MGRFVLRRLGFVALTMWSPQPLSLRPHRSSRGHHLRNPWAVRDTRGKAEPQGRAWLEPSPGRPVSRLAVRLHQGGLGRVDQLTRRYPGDRLSTSREFHHARRDRVRHVRAARDTVGCRRSPEEELLGRQHDLIGALVFIGLPEFVSGIVLIYIFSFKLGVLPAQSPIDLSLGFWTQWQMLILPAVTISLTNLAYVTRMTRSSTVQVLETDYVRTAYLKGLPRHTVIGRHVLRNSLLPTVTIIALCMGWLVGGYRDRDSVLVSWDRPGTPFRHRAT